MTRRENGNSDQLAAYARDFKTLAHRERQMSSRFDEMLAQLELYASDLKTSVDAERVRTREVEQSYRSSLLRLARAVDLRDRATGEHADRLSEYARIVCESLRMPEDETTRIRLAAPLHDLGKVGIPDSILLKPAALTEPEWQIIRSHCGMGASLLRGSSSPWLFTAHEVALTHHEHWDGTGYPQGLRGDDIPLCGRIVKLVDCYDTMRSTRPFKPPASAEESRRGILEGTDRIQPGHFDPRLLDLFESQHAAFDETFRRCGGR